MRNIFRILLCCLFFVSVASADRNMYWVCTDANGLWDVPANWENSPGLPDYNFPGDDATGTNLNTAWAVIQQRNAMIKDSNIPTGRVERFYVGGPSGATLTFDTTSTINAYKFYTGNGSGSSATINHYNGTFNSMTGGSVPPYLEFGRGGGDTTYNIYGGTFACNYLYGPHSSSVGTFPTSTINVDGGTWAPGGRAWLGSTPDAVFNVNLISGSINSVCKYFYIGVSGGSCYFNQTGGTFLATGTNFVPVGWSDGHGEITVSGGNFDARVPIIIPNGVFKVVGSGATNISMYPKLGGYEDIGFGFGYGSYGDGIDETLAVELDASGITPIRVNGGGYANLKNITFTVDTLAGFVSSPGTVYPILYASATTDAIWEDGLKLVCLNPQYDFEWFIEDDTLNGGQWLKIRQLTTSVWNGGTGQWNVAANWQGGLPSSSQSAAVIDGQVSLATDGSVAEAKKLFIGGTTNPELVAGTNSQLDSGDLNVATLSDDLATININGGQINSVGETVMASGEASDVSITQTAGDVNITGEFNMGYYTGTGEEAVLNYNMSGGTLTQTGYVFRLGYSNSSAYFTQTGGDVVLDVNNLSSCRFGYGNGWAEYAISGGSLECNSNFVVKYGVFAVLGSSVDEILIDRIAFVDPDDDASDATFKVGLDAGGVTPVTLTGGKARFYDGAKIVVDILPGFNGAFGTTYDLITTPISIQGDWDVSCTDANYTFDAYVVADTVGEILRLELGFSNDQAESPTPENGSKACYQDLLSWQNPAPSQPDGTIVCDVLITNADTDPNFLSPTKVLDKQPVNEVLATLSPETNYLWRVDVYDQSYSQENKVIGDIWSFSTNVVAAKTLEWKFDSDSTVAASYQQAIHPDDIMASASTSYYLDGPAGSINSCGLSGMKHCQSQKLNGTHWTSAPLDWWPLISAPGSSAEGIAWIKYDFDQPYQLGNMFIWNHNGIGSLVDLRGMKNITVEYSADGSTYTTLGTYTLNDATHAADYQYNNTINFNGVTAKSVILTADDNYGGECVGLAEVRFGLSGTTDTITTTSDSVGSCTASAKCEFVDSSVYNSSKCSEVDDGLDSIYSQSANANVPTGVNEPWSMSFYLYTEQYPQNYLLLAGFGNSLSLDDGSKRFVDVGANGTISFWSDDSATDLTTSVQYDIRKWQLITATYDGTTLRLYKNASLAGSLPIEAFENIAEQKASVLPATGRDFRMSEFFGKIDNVTIYSGVLSIAEMEDMVALMPVEYDINTDAVVDFSDLKSLNEQWLTTAGPAGPVDDTNFVTWSEGFEDGNDFKTRWTANAGDWSGKDAVTEPFAPEGSDVLSFTVPSNYMQRSIGSMEDVFEVSWYYRADSNEGSADTRFYVVDEDLVILMRVHHRLVSGEVQIYADTSDEIYTFVPGNDYTKVTLRVDYSARRGVLFIDDQLFESDLPFTNAEVGPAASILLRKLTDTEPTTYIDSVTVSQSTYGVDYPLSDFNDDGFVDFADFAEMAGLWMLELN